MTSDQHKVKVRCSFNSFCKKTLRNEAINAHTELKKRKNTILNFSDIDWNEETMFGAQITPIIEDDDFYLIKRKVINKERLFEAINRLKDQYRCVVELYYFYELNDRNISEKICIPRSTVQNWRRKALNLLRNDLEENANDQSYC